MSNNLPHNDAARELDSESVEESPNEATGANLSVHEPVDKEVNPDPVDAFLEAAQSVAGGTDDLIDEASDNSGETQEELLSNEAESHGSTRLDSTIETVGQSNADSYFSDDEQFLSGDDIVISQDESIGIIQQLDGVISWELVNFYNEDGDVRSKASMRNEPPVMRISSSTGDFAEFVVTKDLARTLSDLFSDVHRAYFGVPPKSKNKDKLFSQEGMKNKANDIKEWSSEHPVQTVLLALLVVLVIVSPWLFS